MGRIKSIKMPAVSSIVLKTHSVFVTAFTKKKTEKKTGKNVCACKCFSQQGVFFSLKECTNVKLHVFHCY